MKNILFTLLLLPLASVAQIITTVAGTGTQGYSGDGGQAVDAQLNEPYGIAIDSAGNIYFADRANSRIRVIRQDGDVSGNIFTIAGNGTAGYSGDGGLATNAMLNYPTGICLDHAQSNLYIADAFNQIIRKIDLSTGIITTVVGTPTVSGGSSGVVPATDARLFNPSGVWLDASGDMYICDYDNYAVKMVAAATGMISVYISNCPYAPSACFPSTLCRDNRGNTYIAEDFTGEILKQTGFSDTLQTIAGIVSHPHGITLDPNDNVYYTDLDNGHIWMFNQQTGLVTLIAGNGSSGYAGDGGLAINAAVQGPNGLCFDNSGNLYITENHKIRKVSGVYNISESVKTIGGNQGFNVFPNPSQGAFTVRTGVSGQYQVAVYNILGQKVFENSYAQPLANIDIANAPSGIYFISVTSDNGTFIQKMIVDK